MWFHGYDFKSTSKIDTSIELKYYNEINGDIIPNNIIKIKFSDIINTINNLPKSIYILKLDDFKFCKIINNLPNSLYKLYLRCNSFNQKINKLPNSLHKLFMNCNSFNQKINSCYLPKDFNIISNVFNNNLDGITLPYKNIDSYYKIFLIINSFNKTFNNLPNIFNDFTIGGRMFNNSINNLPNVLKTLALSADSFNKKLTNLPTNLILKIYFSKINVITNVSHLILFMNKTLNFSNTVKILDLYQNHNTLDFLPEGLEVLKLSCSTIQVNDLPSSVKEIWIEKKNKKFINKIYHHKIKYF